MAITNYLRLCDYSIGGLKPYVYIINKDALKLKIKAKGIEVFFDKRKESDILKIEAQSCVFNQEETYQTKFRFNSVLNIVINEQYDNPLLYQLRTLRTNKYYIIIEDKKGTQYLVNPEMFTKMEYEYTFTDINGENNNVSITFTNLSNYPLLIFTTKIDENDILILKKCNYNIGNVKSLNMTLYSDLKVNDDGVKTSEIYIDNIDLLKIVEFSKETFNLKETYDGKRFTTELSFSIPLSNHQFEWAYDLIEFEKNRYKAIFYTTNNNYIIVGNEKGLFPSYSIQTSEDDDTPNLINFTFTQISQYPILYTNEIKQYRWIEDEPLCFGYDKYQMLKQQISNDWGQTWEDVQPIVKKKGKLIESNSEDCKEYRWIDDETYCLTISNEYYKWIKTNDYICLNGDKYDKLQKYYSEDNIHFTEQDEYAKGNLIEENSSDCDFVAVRWIDANDYKCFTVNEELTRWVKTDDVCVGTDLYESEIEEVTSNGTVYYPSGEQRNGVLIEEDCCECGYREYEFRNSNNTICGSELTDEELTIIRDEGYWSVSGNTFKSDKNNFYNITSEKIYFSGTTSLNLSYIQERESNCIYAYISKIDREITTIDKNTYLYTTQDNESGEFIISVPDTNEHFIQIIFENHIADTIGDNQITITLSSRNIFEDNYRYEIWEEWEFCPKDQQYDKKTGHIDYRNPKPDCDCGFEGNAFVFEGQYKNGDEIGQDASKIYEVWVEMDICTKIPTGRIEYRNPKDRFIWKIEGEKVCGNALPEGTIEVDTPPTNN